ncbi:hypothetical protein ACFVSK_10290 [Cellulosimicrobium cellulans]|uniref:hypothetical protein n=1 Tax=Cellulosimicrobium cellulans TaxID=1710 RepID=UPI0036EEBF12
MTARPIRPPYPIPGTKLATIVIPARRRLDDPQPDAPWFGDYEDVQAAEAAGWKRASEVQGQSVDGNLCIVVILRAPAD